MTSRWHIAIRTGWPIGPSATRLAEMSAAILAQGNAPPQVAHELAELLSKGHRLIEVGQEVAGRGSTGHCPPLLRIAPPAQAHVDPTQPARDWPCDEDSFTPAAAA